MKGKPLDIINTITIIMAVMLAIMIIMVGVQTYEESKKEDYQPKTEIVHQYNWFL